MIGVGFGGRILERSRRRSRVADDLHGHMALDRSCFERKKSYYAFGT